MFSLLGLLCSFLAYVFKNSSFENINKEKQQKRAIFNLFDQQELVFASFIFFELICYSFSIIALTAFLIIHSVVGITFIVLFFLLFIGYILRVVITALGNNLSEKVINWVLPAIQALFALTHFLGEFHLKLRRSLTLKKDQEVSLDKIQEMVENAHEGGSIASEEYKILSNLIRFNKVPISDVMTPRTVIFACNANLTVKECLNLPEIKMFSRFPIYEGKSLEDKVVGYVVTKDILQSALNNEWDKELKDFAREIHFIPENATLDDALNQFLTKKQHIFLVISEYGGVEGLLTMEDVIETILGVEIIDEADKYIDLRELAKLRREKRLHTFIYRSE
ncbi:MAG: CBS domain-containing protein [Candidatus Kapaibacteriales bacterium]